VPDTWGPVLKDGIRKQDLGVVPYELQLDYDYWSYRMGELSKWFLVMFPGLIRVCR
jgi:hypothetical protein